VQERILEVKTAWRRAAHGRMDGILESVRESIEAGAYGEALDAAKSFPEGWLVVEGIEDKHEDLKYLVQRATYLKGKAAGGSSRTPRRPRRGGELALDKTYAVLRDKARVQAAWKPNGEVRYEEKEKELILTVKDDLRRATLFSNYEKQNAWLDYVVEFEYRTNAGLRFLCRVNRRRNRQTIVTLPDASAWRAVRIDVSGVLLKATVGGKTWDDVVVDLDPGYCGFELNRKGTASIRNLRLRITKKE